HQEPLRMTVPIRQVAHQRRPPARGRPASHADRPRHFIATKLSPRRDQPFEPPLVTAVEGSDEAVESGTRGGCATVLRRVSETRRMGQMRGAHKYGCSREREPDEPPRPHLRIKSTPPLCVAGVLPKSCLQPRRS